MLFVQGLALHFLYSVGYYEAPQTYPQALFQLRSLRLVLVVLEEALLVLIQVLVPLERKIALLGQQPFARQILVSMPLYVR